MTEVRVLHVNDCASTTLQLVAEADRRGLPWRYQPLARDGGRGNLLVAGARWAAEMAVGAARSDLLHVHYASVPRHTRWTRRPYVLHAHGTDVRSQQYEPRWTGPIRRALTESVHVYYSTPDLAEHVLPHRPDAEYFPVPLDLDVLPLHAAPDRPTVFFASRWEAVKGLDEQLAVARALAGRGAELLGLDWGPAAAAAREAGVRLLPRTSRPEFLERLAGASVVVGQGSGMLAASELEAVGTGVPVVAALRPDWYPASAVDAGPVVVGGTDAWAGTADERVANVVAGVRSVLASGTGPRDGREWLRRSHDVRAAAERLRLRYRELV